jgi:hypothetical protein
VPIAVGDEKRTFLEDGDRVIFRGWCEKEGAGDDRLRRGLRDRPAVLVERSALDLEVGLVRHRAAIAASIPFAIVATDIAAIAGLSRPALPNRGRG